MSLTRRLFGASVAACAVTQPAFAGVTAADPRPQGFAMLNQPAPAFSLPRFRGGRVRLADYRNKVLILNFGGLWCPDCILDAPYVQRLAQMAEADAHIDFLEIHTLERYGHWGSLETYEAQTHYSWPTAIDAGPTDLVADRYGVEWYPCYLIIDTHGVIRAWSNDLGPEGPQQMFDRARALVAA